MSVNASEAVGVLNLGSSARNGSRAGAKKNSGLTGVRLFVVLTALIAVAGAIVGCGGGKSTTTTVTSVAITPTTITVPLNTTTTFTAVVKLSDSSTSTTTTVTWEVNGTANGNIATVGSIVPLANNQLQATYTAPSSVPTTAISGVTQVGQVSVTAVATQTATSSGSSTPGTVTSNAAIVTVGAGSGLTVTPTAPSVAAGATKQFTALLNGLTDNNAAWSVTPAGDPSVNGSINANGVYTAPLSPPPGGKVTITATDPAANAPATATVTVSYSDHSLTGPYAFSYTGNDSQGFLAVAGSFVADGNGHITSGVEDESSFLTGIRTIQINGSSSTYIIGPDGRGTASIMSSVGQNTWDFVVTTPGYAQITRFDTSATGGGTMDQQTLDAISNSASVITGPYVFSLLGADTLFNPLGLAGKFTADGAGGIPQSGTILDVNDNGIAGGTVTTGDTSLHGSYQFDPVFTGTGRGTLTLISNATAGQRVYAFYAVDTPTSGPNLVTRLHLIEIDNNASVAGDMFSAPAGATALAAGNYVFTGGGDVLVPVKDSTPVIGAYASGGVFVSSGAGAVTGGTYDANAGGTYNNGAAINSCSSYTTDATTGRIDLKIFTGTGSCPATPNTSTNEFALYQTSQGTSLLLEIDANALSTATAYQQCVPPAAACSTNVALLGGSFAIGLIGQGVFHNNSPANQPDASGQIAISSTGSVTGGTLDINTFGAASAADPITTGSSLAAAASSGRGTGQIVVSNPSSTFKIVYYLIDDNTALIFDQDTTPIATGVVTRQF